MSDPDHQKQVWSYIGLGLMPLLALVFLCFVLAACGKRPGSVDPPADVTDDKFPMIYPDPSTDPKPEGTAK
jgi:hypothetical protein